LKNRYVFITFSYRTTLRLVKLLAFITFHFFILLSQFSAYAFVQFWPQTLHPFVMSLHLAPMDLFRYLEEYDLFVCTSCCYCVLPEEARSHLTTQYRGMPLVIWKTIIRRLALFGTKFQKQADFDFLDLPKRLIPIIPHLEGLFYNGLFCIVCLYILISAKRM